MTKRHCVVLAGGMGTRIRDITEGKIPKVLVPVLGKPFLNYKLESLRQMNVTDVIILVGELGQLIEEALDQIGSFGLNIVVMHDGPQLRGTGGSIRQVLDSLPEKFWVTYGDSYVIADLAGAEREAKLHKAEAVMTVYHNFDWPEVSNIAIRNGFVSSYQKGASPGTFEWIDYGIMLLNKAVFELFPIDSIFDLSVILDQTIAQSKVLAFEATEQYWEIGTPEALVKTEIEFLKRFGR